MTNPPRPMLFPEPASPRADAPQRPVAVIGGGPAGLMAAEVMARGGLRVQVFDAMPSVGRKFLLAGKGGLNLTHSEPASDFVQRYGPRQHWVGSWLAALGSHEVRAWAQGLGVSTFVGTSGRVFPTDMKAAPLLRAWMHRLRGLGVQFHMRHRWVGWDEAGRLLLQHPGGVLALEASDVVLALGGGSWARLGSDGAWVSLLGQRGVEVKALRPANCGFDVAPAVWRPVETRRAFLQELAGQAPAGQTQSVGWSAHFAERFAGQPFKSVALSFTDHQGRTFARRGEFVATTQGVEGSLIYAVSALLRDEIEAHGSATFMLDLLPDHSPDRVAAEVRHPRGSRSLSSHLKSRLGLDGIKAAILYEQLGKEGMADAVRLAAAIKALPITVLAPRPLDEAISTAGGVPPQALDEHLMLRQLSGVFCAGEMLDWEAPTGGYLLTACFASGLQAGWGVLNRHGVARPLQ